MGFSAEAVRDSVTSPEVTLKLDADTCYLLSQIFSELGSALYAAQKRYNARERFEAQEPLRRAHANELRASVAAKMAELKGLSPKKIASAVAKALELKWDTADMICADVRREKRKAALSSRNGEVLRLTSEGLSASKIGARLGLSTGTVRNILSRQRRAAQGKAA